ncbi:non-canonical purine NTP pyrophosphatase, RdgB/HAM1 family [Moraxella atlantae]|uniref:dITP/XTP pyrophosphatase n=1 Tax=Faucicola atlantae TaxID=34059 RepID=A0A1B8QEB9_9GAMM|nr:RdgB/HAM1 family non-canonical purine NTP pyrophosphatase [Moraxella atlantae]OBX79980.1 non-canonical purine NTP pyrophosphatase, RdgB/HAM1 family [Moraxella atlantae]
MTLPIFLFPQNQLVLASNNAGKLAELRHMFAQAGLDIEVIAQADLGIDDAIEDGKSFIENALIKARHASAISGLPALADDSGLCVDVLGGGPGIYSARFAADTPTFQQASARADKDHANNQKLLAQLAPYRDDNPIRAQFVCVLALVRHADDPLPMIAQGLWQGQVLPTPQGEHGFGYDPLFWSSEHAKSAAELGSAVKNRVSHRAQALQQLLSQLKNDA